MKELKKQRTEINKLQDKINLNDLLIGLDHNKWYGCFGVQSFINHQFLLQLQDKYNINNMISAVKCRIDRCSLERIMGCLFFTENSNILKQKSLFGNIMKYYKWGYSFEEYEKNLKTGFVPNIVVKVWTGR